MSAWRAVVGLWLGASAYACSLANDRRPCDDVPTAESQVNERVDHDELLGGPHAATFVDDTHLFTAFVAQDIEDGALKNIELRYALVNRATGNALPCNRAALDCQVGDAGNLPRSAAMASAPLSIEGSRAAALLVWVEGGLTGKSYARMRFLDAAGNPLGAAGAFDPFGTPIRAIDTVWSEVAQKIVIVAHDQHDIWLSMIDAPVKAELSKLASATTISAGIVDVPSVAVAGNGSLLVTWFDGARGYQVLALDPQGKPRGNARDAGPPGSVLTNRQGAPSAIAVASDRFAVVGSSSPAEAAAGRVFFQEFSLDGEPMGVARTVDPEDAGHQTQPNAVYLPNDTLLVTWHSATKHGVVGRFFKSDGTPRFCSLGCGESAFDVGARVSGDAAESSRPLLNGGDVWIVHDGQDGHGEGVHLLRARFASLYPAKP
ncbi:MAG TPA: hypothetical protein VHB79_00590 [Polyangiaceae bacterium]|nr:hypothetical protein [Polyangiaceae bacterium]